MRCLLLVAGSASVATAAPMAVTGDVTAAASQWTADGSRIVTEATVTTPTGDVIVSQLGGTVDGLTMRTMPALPALELGMRVTVAAHDAMDLAQRAHTVVDDVVVLAGPAGFVRTGPTKAGHALYWESGCIFVTLDSAGTTAIAGPQEFPIIDLSIATWNTDTNTPACSYMKVVSQGQAPVEVGGKDNLNVIKFRDPCSDPLGHCWCRPAIRDDPMRCYPSAAAGITTATYVDDASSSRDGAIVDADIELNGVDFAISIAGQTTSTAGCKSELQNTLTHELGHLHGLEHTCLAPGDPPRTNDKGQPVPQCSQTSDPAILDATMYNYQDCSETKKESLEPDDTAAICATYPTANDPKTCAPVTPVGAGCCDAGGQPDAALLGLLVCWPRRRKLRRPA